jgi:hypothetical protein
VNEFEEQASNWSSIQKTKHGVDPTPGLVGATDGLVIQRLKPKKKEIDDADYKRWLNRKGYFAYVAQAIVGAYTEFLMFELRWPGATNDSTAFGMSEGMTWLNTMAELYPNGWLSGDDACCALHKLLVTPFTKAQLKKARKDNYELYLMMRAFNQVASSQRITVERAFGILVRRFGCFWTTFENGDGPLMIMVCAKLHNICVHRWRQNNPHTLPVVPSHIDIAPEYDLSDENIKTRLENMFTGAIPRAHQCAKRSALMRQIQESGMRVVIDDFESSYISNDN